MKRISLLTLAYLFNGSTGVKVGHKHRDLNDDWSSTSTVSLGQEQSEVPRSSQEAKEAQESEAQTITNFDKNYKDNLKPSDDTQGLSQQSGAGGVGEDKDTLAWNGSKTKPAAFKAKTTWDEPANLLPEFGFVSSWNTASYQGSVAMNDFPEMRIQTLRKGDGKNCELNQWATVSWKAYINGEDPQEIYNSRREAAGEGPKQFRVGNYQVSKCWDMAIQQMSKGQVAKVLCPAFLDKGGSRNNFRQSGTAWVKEGTDITYEFEVQSCVAQLDFPKDDPIIPRRCMFIVLDKQGEQLALTASTQDKYHPRHTGLYDIIAEKYSGKESKNTMQMWYWDERDHSLRSYGHQADDAVMFEGYNKNLVLYKMLGRDSQKFTFNASTHFWRNDHTKRAMHAEEWKDGANVVTEVVDDNGTNEAIKWHLEYCGNEPTNTMSSGSNS